MNYRFYLIPLFLLLIVPCYAKSTGLIVAYGADDNITNNSITSGSEIVCLNSGPVTLIITGSVPNLTNAICQGFTYQWLTSTDNKTFYQASGVNTGKDYTFQTSTAGNTFLRRIVNSNCGSDTSSPVQISAVNNLNNIIVNVSLPPFWGPYEYGYGFVEGRTPTVINWLAWAGVQGSQAYTEFFNKVTAFMVTPIPSSYTNYDYTLGFMESRDGKVFNPTSALYASYNTRYGKFTITPLGNTCATFTSPLIGVVSYKDTNYISSSDSIAPIYGYQPWVQIGTRKWTMNNLNTPIFNDGTPIESLDAIFPDVGDTGYIPTWDTAKNPGYMNDFTYGFIYNGYVITSAHNVCPVNWHVARDADWQDLMKITKNNPDMLKSPLAIWPYWPYWTKGSPNDSTNFNALPGDYITPKGAYVDSYGINTYWWSGTFSGTNLHAEELNNLKATNPNSQSTGFPIRCVRNY